MFFQESQSLPSSTLVSFHDYGVEIQIWVVIVVSIFVGWLLMYSDFWKFGTQNHMIEFIWTVLPFVIIVLYAFPSIAGLFVTDSINADVHTNKSNNFSTPEQSLAASFANIFSAKNYNEAMSLFLECFSKLVLIDSVTSLKSSLHTELTVFVVGHQWYWDYFSSFVSNSSDTATSYIPLLNTSTSSFLNTMNSVHLLELDNQLLLQGNTNHELVITAADVLHSFAVPSVGIKVDAVPGKDNLLPFEPVKSGIYTGHCSEICGVNHSLMPIGIVVTSNSC